MRAWEAAQAWSVIEQVDRARWGPSVKPLDITVLPALGRLTTNSHLRCFQVRAEITFNRVPRSTTVSISMDKVDISANTALSDKLHVQHYELRLNEVVASSLYSRMN